MTGHLPFLDLLPGAVGELLLFIIPDRRSQLGSGLSVLAFSEELDAAERALDAFSGGEGGLSFLFVLFINVFK